VKSVAKMSTLSLSY